MKIGIKTFPNEQALKKKEPAHNTFVFSFCTALFAGGAALGTWIMTGYKG